MAELPTMKQVREFCKANGWKLWGYDNYYWLEKPMKVFNGRYQARIITDRKNIYEFKTLCSSAMDESGFKWRKR